MQWSDLLIDGFSRVPVNLVKVLDGLTREDLKWQPRPDANSIGWIAWHFIRGQDAQIADLMGEEQLWIKDGWHAKFNLPPDGSDTGFGDTPEKVAAFDPPANDIFIDYDKAVDEFTKQYILSLTPQDLDRELGGPWKPVPTVGVRLISIMQDIMIHAGECAYVRGLLQGKGWQPL